MHRYGRQGLRDHHEPRSCHRGRQAEREPMEVIKSAGNYLTSLTSQPYPPSLVHPAPRAPLTKQSLNDRSGGERRPRSRSRPSGCGPLLPGPTEAGFMPRNCRAFPAAGGGLTSEIRCRRGPLTSSGASKAPPQTVKVRSVPHELEAATNKNSELRPSFVAASNSWGTKLDSFVTVLILVDD